MPSFSAEELKLIIKDYNDGIPLNEMSLKYNRASSAIIMKLQSIGIYKNKNNQWTEEEIIYLKNHYPVDDWDVIFDNIKNRTKENIIKKASNLKIKREICFWSDSDVQILIKNYNSNNSISEIKKMLNNKFSSSSIMTKANKIGINKRYAWTEGEIEILKNNYESVSIVEIMKLLPGRSKTSIISYANEKLNLINRNFWSEEEIKILKEHWKSMEDYELGLILNRKPKAIQTKRLSLGLCRVSFEESYGTIQNYVRVNNFEWKNISMERCGYKCAISNKKFDDIHHVRGVNLIIKETFSELEIKEKSDFEEYTDNELFVILNKFKEVQSRYPFGICLSKKYHKLFHNIYGYGNNTEDQWNDFIKKYGNNKLKI